MFIMFDVESDGPIYGVHSMISFGAVVVEEGLKRTFYAELKPISDKWVPDALAVSGFTREETLKFEDPKIVMTKFNIWLNSLKKDLKDKERLLFISDNNGYDFPWINYYALIYLGQNPLGHSSNNLRNIYNGMEKNSKASFKFLRDTKHTHNALDDAIGNAEAMLKIIKKGFRI